MSKTLKLKITIIVAFFLVMPFLVKAQTVGQQVNFFIDSSYDLQGRKELSATLIKITNKLYFFVDT